MAHTCLLASKQDITITITTCSPQGDQSHRSMGDFCADMSARDIAHAREHIHCAPIR